GVLAAELGAHQALAAEALGPALVPERLGVHHLHRAEHVLVRVPRGDHGAHRADAEDLLDAVPLRDQLADLPRGRHGSPPPHGRTRWCLSAANAARGRAVTGA